MNIYRVLDAAIADVAGQPVTTDRIVMLTAEQAAEPLANGEIEGPFDSFPMTTGIKTPAAEEPDSKKPGRSRKS